MPSRGSEPVAVFRVHAEYKSLYVRVRIWPTQAAMHAFLRRHGYTRHFLRRTGGLCTDMHPVFRPRKAARRDTRGTNGCVAEINLHVGHLGVETVAHECFHAALAWARRVKVEFPATILGVTDDEERIAYLHGRLARDIVKMAYTAGCYD